MTYEKSQDALSKLTPQQYHVTQESGTERALVVSRMWWKLASSGLRACNDGSSQAARSRDIGSSG